MTSYSRALRLSGKISRWLLFLLVGSVGVLSWLVPIYTDEFAWKQYFLALGYVGHWPALLAAFLLLCQPLHLFFGRASTIVALDGLWMTLIISSLTYALRKADARAYAVLGVVVGFGIGLHAAVRAPCFLSIAAVGALILWHARARRITRKQASIHLALFFACLLAGFGPRLLFSTPSTVLVAGGRIPFLKFMTPKADLGAPQDGTPFLTRAKKSLLVYTSEPTTPIFFPESEPLLTRPLAVLFVFGVAFAFIAGPVMLWRVCLAFAFILPITNSALTDYINADHRMSPMLPIAALLIALAVRSLLSLRNVSWAGRALGTIALLVGFWESGLTLRHFFIDESASRIPLGLIKLADGWTTANYPYNLSVSLAIRAIQEDEALRNEKKICIAADKKLSTALGLAHVRERFTYFLEGKTIDVVENESAADDRILFSTDCSRDTRKGTWKLTDYCATHERFVCPAGTTLPIFAVKRPPANPTLQPAPVHSQ